MLSLVFALTLADPCSPLLTPAGADVVYLASGETRKGLVVEEHRDRIVVSTEEGERTIPRGEVEEVFYDDPERNYLYLGNQALEYGGFALARGFFRKAAQANPTFEEAEEALRRLEDLERKATSMERIGNPAAALERRWGLELQSSEPWAKVRQVQTGSLVHRAGILVGDALVSYWDSSLGFLPMEEVAQILLGPAGSSLRLTLERSILLKGGSSESREPAKKSWPGCSLEMKRLGLTVTAVDPTGAAYQGGLRAQDRIVSIGGVATRYMPMVEVRRRIQQAKPEGLPLAIHRDLMIRRE